MTGARVAVGPWRYALRDAGLSATEHHVALALAVYMNGDGSRGKVSERRLAADCSRNKDTIGRVLVELTRRGWLIRQPAGHRRSPEYLATIPDCPSEWGHPCPRHGGQGAAGVAPCTGCRCPLCDPSVPPVEGAHQQLPASTRNPSRVPDWNGQESGAYR